MTVSQNGYTFGDSSLIATYTVVRDVKLSLRKGDASVVLLHLARWFDKNIEPLKKAECGGYNPRVIKGSKIRSNHGSGTAEDLNWNSHVQGKKNTFSAADQKKIRAQLKFYEGVIRWGGDYSGTVDDMHFEINKPPAELARIAKKCKEDTTKPKPIDPPKTTIPVTPPKPTSPAKPSPPHRDTTPVDSKLGPDTIRLWQRIMGTPVDGIIDDKHSELITAVQKKLKSTVDRSLVVDGQLGPRTIRDLQRYLRTPVDGRISEPKSEVIRALQTRLNKGLF
jgi:hypothetical protein